MSADGKWDLTRRLKVNTLELHAYHSTAGIES